MNLIIGSTRSLPITRIRIYELLFDSNVRVDVLDFLYSCDIKSNIISFHTLFGQGYRYSFDIDNGFIYVYKSGIF